MSWTEVRFNNNFKNIINNVLYCTYNYVLKTYIQFNFKQKKKMLFRYNDQF